MQTQGAVRDGLVWHYTNGPGLISILSHHVLWATAAPFLNDKQEVALGGDLISRRLIELGEAEGADEFFAHLAHKVRDGIIAGQGPSPASFFILSATTDWDSLVMWRNYGGANESYAIGLDASAHLQVLGAPDVVPDQYGPTPGTGVHVRRTTWEPVRYTEAEQLALVDAVFDDLPEEFARFHDRLGDISAYSRIEDLPADAYRELDATRDDLEQALLLIKHPGFIDERETRKAVVIWAADNPEAAALVGRLVRYRSTTYGMAPYLELTGEDPDAVGMPIACHASPLPIRAVAISPSPNGDDATESLRGLLSSRGYGAAEVLRSSIPFRG